MTDDSTSSPKRLDIDWPRTIAGALAAVASAVLLSTLGAAGTLIGAALGSVVVTVTSALLAQGLTTSTRTLTKAQTKALHKVGIAHAEVRRAGRADDTQVQQGHLEHADARLAEAHQELDAAAGAAAEAPVDWHDRLAGLPWKHLALAAAGLFLAVLVVITAFELAAGRSVASYTGGSGDGDRTTIGDVGGGAGGAPDKDRDKGTDPGGGESQTPSPTGTAPPSQEPATTPTPSETPEPTPSEVVTPATTPTPAPSEAPAS